MARATSSESPPGAVPLLGHFPVYARDPLGFVTRVSADHGGVVALRLEPIPALLLTEPAAAVSSASLRQRLRGRAGMPGMPGTGECGARAGRRRAEWRRSARQRVRAGRGHEPLRHPVVDVVEPVLELVTIELDRCSQ
jgi:hypothetical protein